MALPDYPGTLAALLVAEYGKTPEDADRLVNKHTRLVMAGIMGGMTYSSVRACAMAIEMAESEEAERAALVAGVERLAADIGEKAPMPKIAKGT